MEKDIKKTTKTKPVILAHDPDKFIIIPENEEDLLPEKLSIEKMKNFTKEPVTPQPGKLPEINPLIDPITPIKYPEENPIEPTKIPPSENPPYIVPKPQEYPI